MAGVAKRIGALVGAVCVAFVLWPSAPAAASTRPAPLELGVTGSAPAYPVGRPVTLHAVVTNRTPGACDLVDIADGQLHVLAGRRDGAALSPSFGRRLFNNGISGEIALHARAVGAGESVSFTVESQGSNAISAVTPQRDGAGLVAQWPVDTPGSYEFRLAYQVSPLAGARACAGSSNEVTVAFVVHGAVTPSGLPAWAVPSAVALTAALLLLALWLSRRARRRRRLATGTAVVLTAVLGLALVQARPAHAKVEFPGLPPDLTSTYADCVTSIIAFDPGLWSVVNGGPPPTIGIIEEKTTDSESVSKSGNTIIWWNARQTGTFQGDPGGAMINPCAELYHELIHAYDAANGTLTDRECDSTGILYDEVRATLKENQYRAAHPPLKQRTTYPVNGVARPLPDLNLLKQLGLIHGAGLDQLLDDFCFHAFPPKPRPSQIPFPSSAPRPTKRHCGAATCANSGGDPHLFTFDDAFYDFQAVGEFSAAISSTGDLAIQVRQAAVPGSRIVSVNSAVAVRVGATRLGFYRAEGATEIHRDGSPVQPPVGEATLPGGAAFERRFDPYSGDVYVVRWPDSTQVVVSADSRWGLSLSIAAASGRRGTMSGLLGDNDGDARNDLRASDGTRLALPPSAERLYHDFADAWRVTDATSLFDYAAGESTATFTDRTFPDRSVSVADLPAAVRAQAATACAALGVADPVVTDACVLDVALTGQPSFAAGAADGETGRLTGPKEPEPIAGPIGTIAIGGPVAVAAIAQPGESVRLVFSGTKGQKVSVEVVSSTLPDSCSPVTLRGSDGGALGSTCVIDGKGLIDALVLPVTGQYAIVVDPAGRDTGVSQLRLVTASDQAGTLTLGGSPATMTIGQAGATARLTFAGVAGDKVFVDVISSTLPDSCWPLSLRRPGDDVQIGIGCIIDNRGFVDGTVLPTTGLYSIVLDPPGTQTGITTVRLLAAADQVGAILLNGPAVTATISGPGAAARFSFAGTGGQRVIVEVTDATLPDECGGIALLNAEGARIAYGCIVDGKGTIASTTLPATGQYTVVLDPPERQTGRAQVRLRT